MSNADDAAAGMPNAKQLVVQHASHGLFGDAPTQLAMMRFLRAGSLSADRLERQAPRFVVPPPLP